MNRNQMIAAAVIVIATGVFFLNFKGGKDDGSNAPMAESVSLAAANPSGAAEMINPVKEHQQAEELKQSGKYDEAKKIYQTIINDQPGYENIEKVQKELEALNMKMVLTGVPSPYAVEHVVAVGDTLGGLAKKYNTTIELIKSRNGLKKDIIRVGQKLSVWNAPLNIFVDKSQNILMLKTGNEVLKVYRVSTGSNNSTPIGDFTVTTKLVDPVWFNKGIVVPPDSPQNVLGTRWLGFNLSGYGIHGTVEPEMIGQQVTAGCVRMRNPEVEELYDIVPSGTNVTIVD